MAVLKRSLFVLVSMTFVHATFAATSYPAFLRYYGNGGIGTDAGGTHLVRTIPEQICADTLIYYPLPSDYTDLGYIADAPLVPPGDGYYEGRCTYVQTNGVRGNYNAPASLYTCAPGWIRSGLFCTGGPDCLPGYARDFPSGQCVRNPKGNGAQCVSTPYPIGIGAGNKYLPESDYPSSTSSLAFLRSYNASLAIQATTLGAKWRGVGEVRINAYAISPAIAIASRPDGKRYTFTQSGSGYQTDADITDRLTVLTDSSGTITGWRYVSTEAIESYDRTGKLTSVTRRDGSAQNVSYSVVGTPSTIAPYPGLAISVTDVFGRQLSLTYDSKGRIIKMTDPAGSAYLYAYDEPNGNCSAGGCNNLTSVTFPSPSGAGVAKKTYWYNEATHINAGAACPSGSASSANLLTGITDENGVRYATYEYDCQGRAVKEYHGAGTVDQYSLTYSTDANGNPIGTVVTDPLGSARTYGFATILGVVKSTGVNQPGGSGCSAASNAQTYDANGNISSRTDFDSHKSCHGYDLTRNLETARLEGLGASANCPADAAAIGTYVIPSNLAPTSPQRKVTTAWHPDWRLEIKRAEPKKLTTWVYNGQPDPTNSNAIASCAPSSALLPDGKPIAVLCKQVDQATTDATGTLGFSATVTGTARVSTWTYNQYGQVLTANGPRTDVSDTTAYSYYADTVFDGTGVGHTVGDLQTLTNAKGQVSTFTQYDRHGHPLELQDANGNVTRLTYHPRGWLTRKSVGPASGTRETTQYDYDAVGQLKKVTNADSSYITYTYDDAHRLTDIGDGKGNSIHYTLDAMGNRTQEEVTDPLGTLARSQRSVYDALGRLQNLITPQ